jgi:AraC-like DNA-binding protein
MDKKHHREKQAAVLRRTQAQRKEQKKEQVLKAIQQLQEIKEPLTFSNIAKVAGCSVSYLYKWSEITTYIHDLQNQEEKKLHSLEEKPPQPHSLKTLHEVSKQRIQELNAEIKELKRQNEQLRGHVVEIFELREECDRLRIQLRELALPKPSTNIVPLQLAPKNTSNTRTDEVPQEIVQLIEEMGINLGLKLKQEIVCHDSDKVKLSIQAFKQYRRKTTIENPGGCLLSMIRDEAKPNIFEKLTSSQSNQKLQPKVDTAIETPQKGLVSLDKLKQLGSIFNNKDE